MWNDLKTRHCAFYQVHVTSERHKAVSDFLKLNKAKHPSRSAMLQTALLEKLERDKPLLNRNPAIDPLRLAGSLVERRAEEKRRARRVVRWCLVLDVQVDEKVRAFLKAYGARHGALCRYVDDALAELIDPSLIRSAARNAPRQTVKQPAMGRIRMPMLAPMAPKDFGVGQHT
jgi:hypothetical protein